MELFSNVFKCVIFGIGIGIPLWILMSASLNAKTKTVGRNIIAYFCAAMSIWIIPAFIVFTIVAISIDVIVGETGLFWTFVIFGKLIICLMIFSWCKDSVETYLKQ